ncbi:hypothetical protein B0920_09060 [Massilia sp. KIM]|uniref:hypothetical protein n=1 Tax=Massilia sp. KIM TaxID=1955422 RepID=UPI00098F74BC|nr:hypothetical protein [Massilia sp. KIM]OON63497.1 hypothetical protein B0920_09060 [Massilia sp. KIM]
MSNETRDSTATIDAPARRQRTDIRTRDLINQAIASVPTLGLQRAAEFLATMNVPAEVAVRVLVYPQRRRAN